MLDAPLTFDPILVPKVWGGRRLTDFGKTLPDGQAIGESWELADMPGDGPCSVVSDGPLAGQSLRQLLADYQEDILGRVPMDSQGRFPLLIKFLDACDNLSVQVHPDQAWANAHPDAHLKSEAWVVLDTEPESRIWVGVAPETSAESMKSALNDDRLTDCLDWRAAIIGSCHTLPSGTCHALGRGVLVAEVQTTSDTTFRLWDWGRDGRTMHVDQALACIDFTSSPPAEVAAPQDQEGLRESELADTPWFQMWRIDSSDATTWRKDLQQAPMVAMCLQGAAHVTGPGGAVHLPRGRTALIPACLAQATLELGEMTSVLLAQPRTDAAEN